MNEEIRDQRDDPKWCQFAFTHSCFMTWSAPFQSRFATHLILIFQVYLLVLVTSRALPSMSCQQARESTWKPSKITCQDPESWGSVCICIEILVFYVISTEKKGLASSKASRTSGLASCCRRRCCQAPHEEWPCVHPNEVRCHLDINRNENCRLRVKWFDTLPTVHLRLVGKNSANNISATICRFDWVRSKVSAVPKSNSLSFASFWNFVHWASWEMRWVNSLCSLGKTWAPFPARRRISDSFLGKASWVRKFITWPAGAGQLQSPLERSSAREAISK